MAAHTKARLAMVTDLLDKGLTRGQIIEKVIKVHKVSEATIDTDIAKAKVAVNKRAARKEEIRIAHTDQATIEAVGEAIISDKEIEGILCTLVTGRIKVQEFVKGEAILRDISPMEIIAAADKIFKKRGSNAPTKTEASISIVKLGKDLEDETYVS